jgi:hypothetical protein
MEIPSLVGMGLGVYAGVVLPLVGWAIRTHFTAQAISRRVEVLEGWRGDKEESDMKLSELLQDLRLEVVRLGAIQGSINDSVHRIESRLEAIDK